MECLEFLWLSGSGIREVPSSIEHLTKFKVLNLYNCKNLRDLPDSICKLQQLQELRTPTTKLRPTCNSFDSSSEGYEDLLMKPEYFPALEVLELFETNIVTIPKSISRFPKLRSLSIKNCKLVTIPKCISRFPNLEKLSIHNCKLLSEIQGLPLSIHIHMLSDSQSRSRLLNQVIEIIGISPNRVCGSARSTNYFPSESEAGDISMDRQFSNHSPSETETEMPKWFNHQSVENSIFFWVGRKFPKLAICIVLGHEGFYFEVYISINGYEKYLHNHYPNSGDNNILQLLSPTQQSLQEHLNKSNPTDQNHVKVTYRIPDFVYRNSDGDVGNFIKRWGVHVECTCPPQESAIPNLPLLTTAHDDDDVGEWPFYVSDDKEEYQSPLENLKFLIVENVRKPLEFLPNNLILLKWPHYHFHLPSEYFPKQLVAIGMPHSHISLPKLIKQECRLENLKKVNFVGCEYIRILPKLWVPNLEYLNLRNCENLVEIDECFGYLEKLRGWSLDGCIKLQILPSQLRLKSLYSFFLTGCSRLEKLPDFHQEMECLEYLWLDGSGIREVPSSIEHLTKLKFLHLRWCKNLRDLPDSICKLQQLRELQTPTTKLRPTCNSFDSSFEGYEDILMKPEYFPALSSLELYGANIVTIPKSISRFPKLNSFSIFNCELLSEIQGLSRWIDIHTLLDSQSRSRLLNQVIELIGISPNRVCGRARSTNYFPSESEAGDISMDRQFYNHYRIPNHTSLLGETEMPKWFNHQSVENPIDFWVGRKFPKLAICFVLGHKAFHFNVYISINGYWKFLYSNVSLSGGKNILHIFSPTQQSLQEHLNESNPTDQNHVKVGVDARSGSRGDVANYVKRLGVHVECICPPQESAIPNLPLLTTAHDDDDVVDHMRELPFYLSDDKEEYQSPLVHDDVVDHMRELPFYGSDDKEEYQSPLVHDDTSMSCMSWLVGPTTKLFKLFCFCCTRDFS
ncbi:uncharacterized protein LOC112011160 [Quercus suber]|uniref:uncharacterized protein LOC112011160 n=1 Tax=Quercus suber TaxID=58331 RepID=UPI0032DED057